MASEFEAGKLKLRSKKMKIGIVVSPGGHLAQALEVLSAFEGHEIFLISYKVPNLIGFSDERIKRVYLVTFIGAKRVRLFISLLASVGVWAVAAKLAQPAMKQKNFAARM